MLRVPALVLLFLAPLYAQGSLSDLVPPQTAVVVEYDDLGGAGWWAENMALGRLLVDPEVKRFCDGLGEAIAKGVAGQRARGPDFFMMAGLQPEDFAGIRVRRAGIALVDLERRMPDVVATVEFREGVEKVEKILRQFRTAATMFLRAEWSTEEDGDRTIWSTTVGGVELAHAVVGNRLVLSLGKSRLKQTLAMASGAKMAALSGDATYRATRASMQAERASVLCYANAGRLRAMAESMLGEDQRKFVGLILEQTGLDALESIAFADIPADGNLRTELCLRLRERKGFFSLFQAAPTANPFLAHAPKDAILFSAERYDIAAFVRVLVSWMETTEPGAAGEYQGVMERYRKVLGIDVEKDLLGSLGDEWAAYVGGTPGGSLIPDAVLFVTLKDRARFEKSMRALVERYPDVLAMYGKERAPRLRHRRTQFAGRDIHLLELSTHRGDPIPFVPCWTVADGHAAFALWPQALKHALSDGPKLKDHEAYAAARRRLPDGVVSQTYVDLPRIVGFAWNTLVPVAQGLQGALDRKLEPFGTALNLHDLPRGAAITRHLSPCVSYTKVEDHAIRMGYVSPFGAALGVGGLAGLTGAVAALVAIDAGETSRAHQSALESNRRAEERAMWEARLARMEAQIAELRKLIEEEK